MKSKNKTSTTNITTTQDDYREDGTPYPTALQPAYDFSLENEAVILSHGIAELISENDRLLGSADVMLRLRPRPRVVIHTSMQTEEKPAFLYIHQLENPSLSFNGQVIAGFRGRFNASSDTLNLDWLPQSEPVVFCDMHAKTTISATLHLFNFPDFRGGKHQATRAPAGCALLVLESDEWQISIQSLSNNATHRAWERIRDEGSCLLTHVLKLERKDGGLFTGDEASKQSHLLTNFLSFVNGGWCSTVCQVGFDAKGEKTWETFASPRISNPPYSWFNPFKASQAEILFPLFAKRWAQSEEWQDCLRAAIYWYAQANTGNGSPGIDGAIILAQSALERLAHHHLVVDKRMICSDGLDRLKVSDRMRLLFSSLGLPLEVTTATPDIKNVALKFK